MVIDIGSSKVLTTSQPWVSESGGSFGEGVVSLTVERTGLYFKMNIQIHSTYQKIQQPINKNNAPTIPTLYEARGQETRAFLSNKF